MEGRVNYTVVGVFIVVLTAFLLSVIIWMSVVGHGKFYKAYAVYVQEDVTGLTEESPVRFNGVKVGYIGSISLDEKNPRLVKLILRIQPGVQITQSTYAVLNVQGITGVVYVNLKANSINAAPLIAAPGEPYPVIPSRPSLLVQLSEVLPELTKDLRNLSSSVGGLLDAQNRQSIKDSLKNFSLVTQTLADNAHDFTDTMHSLDNALTNISEASNRLPNTVSQLNRTLLSVDHLSNSMENTSASIEKTMQSGQVVIHHFSNQVMPSAEQALSNLSAATSDIHQLASQLQRNPSMLVRGKEPALPGPGEK